jgi:hypothetical protein
VPASCNRASANPALEREDVDAGLSCIFGINAKLSRIDEDLEMIAA